jgi:hypothetical protein
MSDQSHTIGDRPLDPRNAAIMKGLAGGIDTALKQHQAGLGFILMVFPLGEHGGRANYISNANRDDVILLLREQLARFEKQKEARNGNHD